MTDANEALAFECKAERLAETLRAVNRVIFANGAPLGSAAYFEIRALCVDTLRAEGFEL